MTAMISDSSSGAHGEGKLSARSAGERRSGGIRDILARLQPGQADRSATAVPTPFQDVPETYRVWMVAAFMLGAIARDTLGDPDTADLLARMDRFAPPSGQPSHHFGALSPGEIRVLRYLQTNLSAREVACELFISVNTVKTHQRHLYQKLGVHSRTQAVEQARALGLLAPAARRR